MTQTTPIEPTPVHIPTIEEIDTDQLLNEIEALQARRLRMNVAVDEINEKRRKKSDAGIDTVKLDAKIQKFYDALEKFSNQHDKLEKMLRDIRIAQMELEG